MADGGEDDVGGIALAALEMAAAEVSVDDSVEKRWKGSKPGAGPPT